MSIRKLIYGFGILWLPLLGHSQELYVFSDPASNIPARSLSAKIKSHGVGADQIYGRFTYRVMPQLMAGITKKMQVRLSASASNMHTDQLEAESIGLGMKYRFLSKDGIHRHFRMASFGRYSFNNSDIHQDEIETVAKLIKQSKKTKLGDLSFEYDGESFNITLDKYTLTANIMNAPFTK